MAGIPLSAKNTTSIVQYVSYIIAFVVVLFLIFNSAYCRESLPARSSLGASPIINEGKISSGYTLLSPFSASPKATGGGFVYLVDLFGKPVHRWLTNYQPLYAILKKNGNLVVALNEPNKTTFPGDTGIIQELDWNSNIIFEYRNRSMHHDFEVLPNGNIAALVWERLPDEIAKNIKGGTQGTEYKGGMYSDAIIEVNKAGEVVWAWHAHEHLKPENYSLGPLTPRSKWTFANSLRYLEKDPFDKEEAYLISFRYLNTVAIIKKKDGSIVWKSRPHTTSYQHDATMLPNGNILVFNNNVYKKPNPEIFQGSRVVEINPKTNRIVWEFNGGETGPEKARFKADILSGAQRLPNNNTLIVNGPAGHLFEVTPKKEIVWDFISPYSSYSNGAWPNNAVFKARRYSPEEINWPGKISEPMPVASVACDRIRKILR